MADVTLPQDVWTGLHQDGTLCLDWTYLSFKGAGMLPLIRVRDTAPPTSGECSEGGEQLRWTRTTLMPLNAAARYGGTARMIDED